MTHMIDVLVVGGGPAGRALAAECGSRGLMTTLVDPSPDAPWRATYAAWLDELPDALPPPAATARGRVVAHTAHTLDRSYAVLDVPALRAHLDARLDGAGVDVIAGRVSGHAGSAVVLADGTRLAARAVVDAGGHRPPLGGGRHGGNGAGPTAAEQTAYGVVVDAATAAPIAAEESA
ncbi:MAG: lycopene cyclase, partial [Pseudonocardia sp.]|nr:lycopene cyclase [Pseudonocardia sp.]